MNGPTTTNARHAAARLLVLGALMAAAQAAGQDPGVVTTNVGVEGTYYARYTGPALEAKPVDESAPIVLRIADLTEDQGSTIYELRYVGNRPGSYDLGDYLARVDGEPITGLGPLTVAVEGLLPEDHDGALEKHSRPRAAPGWRYRWLLGVAGALWLVPLVWVAIRRWTRREKKPQRLPTAEPTLADQLRPLVEEALAGSLSPAGQARLEMLLIAHWRRRLDLTGCSISEALQRMRQHRESGELLRHLERWLHEPPGTPVDVASILEPYRYCAAVDAEEAREQSEQETVQ